MQIEFPKVPPGVHPSTSALARLLNFKGVVSPINNEPYSEALLLGIGGGLDLGYLLYKFAHLPHPMLLLGFRYQWNHTRAFLENIIARLNLNVSFQEEQEFKLAQQALQNVLKEGHPAIVWVDKASLPYHHLPRALRGYIRHQVAVYARDGRLWQLYLDDLSSQPITIREKIFTEARANLSLRNFLMMSYLSNGEIDPQELCRSIRLGIKDCAAQLMNPIKTVGISNLITWASSLVNQNTPRSWQQIFKDQAGLYPVMKNIYESIKLDGSDGFALRKCYAAFLQEASGILNNPSLNAIAGQYLQLANHWSNLAESALPSTITPFNQIKQLLNKKYDTFRSCHRSAHLEMVGELGNLEAKLTDDFPMGASEMLRCFDHLASQVNLISELELSAAKRLQDVAR